MCVYVLVLCPLFSFPNESTKFVSLLVLFVQGYSKSIAKYFTFYHLIFSLLSYQTDMHDLRLIHTDLKPENILLVSSDYIKLPAYKVPGLLWQKNMSFPYSGLDLIIIHKNILKNGTEGSYRRNATQVLAKV